MSPKDKIRRKVFQLIFYEVKISLTLWSGKDGTKSEVDVKLIFKYQYRIPKWDSFK